MLNQPALGRNLTYAPYLWDPSGPDPLADPRDAFLPSEANLLPKKHNHPRNAQSCPLKVHSYTSNPPSAQGTWPSPNGNTMSLLQLFAHPRPCDQGAARTPGWGLSPVDALLITKTFFTCLSAGCTPRTALALPAQHLHSPTPLGGDELGTTRTRAGLTG